MDPSRVTVVIPSLNPDEKLARTVDGLIALGFTDILLVNDGSTPQAAANFPDRPECTLLVHPVNRGKGAALKTAFRAFLDSGRAAAGVITVDGDGQHLPEDVLRCAEAMAEREEVILGVRDFSQPDVPVRSRFGNRTTSLIFRIFCGLKISDTQTGLRAIPARYLPAMLEVEGDRYEFETNMLLMMKSSSIPFSEVQIRTVYLEENQASHFRPIRDSLRIYSQLLLYAFSSITSSLLDLILFFLLSLVLTSPAGVMISATVARVLSSILNYILNKKTVFRTGAPTGRSLFRYIVLAAAVMLVSAGSVTVIAWIFGLNSESDATLKTAIKFVIDVLLFFVNFRLQREWVFAADDVIPSENKE